MTHEERALTIANEWYAETQDVTRMGPADKDRLTSIISALVEQAAQPVWSREEPKGEGWYQYKDLDDTEEGRQVCRVSVINGRMLALFFDGDSAELESLNGEWATIPLPREA